MAIWQWITRFRRGRDAAALQRAENRAVETPREREATSGDIEAIQADEEAAERMGGTRTEIEELGD